MPWCPGALKLLHIHFPHMSFLKSEQSNEVRAAGAGQSPAQPANACQDCGATTYRPLIKRDICGQMRPSGRYACTGCKREFAQIDEWRRKSAI